MKRILIFIPLALIVAIAAIAHSAYVRPIYFNNVTTPIQPGTPVEIVIPSSYVDGFQGLYVSSNPSCSVQLDTWYRSFGDYILVIFKPDTTITNGTTMYMCYGDIYYNPVNMWVYLTDKELTTSVNSSVQYVSGSDNNWYYVNGQSTIVLHDFGKLVHIVNTSISFTIYPYSSTAVEILDKNGNVVAQKTYSAYTTDTISASNYDTTELAIVVSGNAWIEPTNWDAYYREYVYNETAENVTGHSAWMIIASGDSGYVMNNGNYVNISGNIVNGESAGQPVHVIYTPKGWGWYAQSSVHFYTGTDSNTTTLAATIYAYEGSSTMAFSIYYLDIPRNYSYTIGGASYVSISSGGGGGGTGTTGNNTIVVNVQTGTEQAKAMYQAMGFLAFILGMAFVSYTLVGHRVEWLLAATASVLVAGMLLNYGGDYRTSYYMVLAGISIIVGVTVYRLLEQMIMR